MFFWIDIIPDYYSLSIETQEECDQCETTAVPEVDENTVDFVLVLECFFFFNWDYAS